MPADMSEKEREQLIHQDGIQTEVESSPLNVSRSTRTLQGPRAPYSTVALVCTTVLAAALVAGTVALHGGSVLREQSAEKGVKGGVIGLILTKHRNSFRSKSASHDSKASSSGGSSMCAGDDEDCSSSKCCSEPGMQCYEKSKGKAYCRASCTAGPDFASDKHEIWTCDKLGKRANGTAEPAPKTKFEEIPAWVERECTEHSDISPHDCSKTMCCKGSGMQCFQKEEGWAVCDQECMPGEHKGDGYWQCNRLGPRTPMKCPECAAKSAPKPDMVILFFERDLCKMKYTARSLGVNDPDKNLGDVHLMWVSSHSASEYQADIDEIKASIEEYKTVYFTDWSQRMASVQPPIDGWHAQQVVKLKIAFEIQSEFYIVMDSKNTLIQPVTPHTFFTPCGQGIIQAEFPYDKIPVPHSEWYARSAAALNLDPPASGFWPASITPIVMHRQTVLDMLQQLGEDPNPQVLCNGRLCEAIGAFWDMGFGATEFTLYTLFAYSKRADGTFDCIHSIEKMQHFKVQYSKSWKDEMHQMISGLGFPEDLKQISVSDVDGWPMDWTPDCEGEEPGEVEFPLVLQDVTKKWASSLWRGEESNAELLVQVNLHTLRDVTSGVRQFPIMFGAQTASLVRMSEEQRAVAVGHLVNMYKRANLYDPDDDLVECTIGWKN
mmetsp:Transcript_2850/g.8817  ORF Transcript_2850/g.8817 Transcript_2850/m.8817 type:complete len:662 (+) Transcript_2850:99-2084(+)